MIWQARLRTRARAQALPGNLAGLLDHNTAMNDAITRGTLERGDGQ